ncbi:MAG: adenylosuccinate lyase [Rhodobacteraceae bacterium]|nr:MAG: adenylosuccinate lyase [Paracoccaceae bacterium]
MVPRYSRPEMVEIWSQQNKFKIWYEIEAHACDAQAELGVIPKEAAKSIWQAKDLVFDVDQINKIEKETKHDVIAFLTFLGEHVGQNSRFIHQGMTSSDILDTCFNIQLTRATGILIKELKSLLNELKRRANEFKYTVCMGRSHGVHAEPTTFGLKLVQAYSEMNRNLKRLELARDEVRTGAISGAVGTFATIDPFVERHVCQALGLIPEPVSSQIIPRDRHALFFSVLGLIASSIERISIEIRHLQRSEVLEVEEYFSQGQKGSSAMPHKRNPVLSENLSGLSRLVRMSVIPSLENVALWHERDISHSSVERAIGPDTTITLDFALHRLTDVIKNLIVYPENMATNLNKFKGLFNSQAVLMALTQKGLSREKAYELVQKNAMKTWDKNTEFITEIKSDDEIKSLLSDKEINEIFTGEPHLNHIDYIFSRGLN